MIDKELYEQVGGLQDSYVQADYEDSDLCLRLIVKGYDNWYLPAAELYHLEGQSIPDAARHLNTRYNLWLHTYLWNDVIEAVMAACDSALAGNVPLAGTEGRSWRSAIAGRLDSDALARHDFLPASLQLQRARKTEGAEKSPGSMSETPDEVNLYLQTCVKTKGPNGNTDERRVPVMNDLGSLMGCSLSQTESVKQIPFETKSHSSTNSKKNVDDRTRKQRIVGFEKAEREKGLEGSRLRPKVKELTSDELQTHTTIRRLQAVLEEAKCKSSEVLRCASIKWIREAVAEVVPADTTVLVVSRGDTLLLDLAGRTAWHFPQGAGGFYAGYHPADSRAAITHLEQLRAAGAAYLLFPLTSFWWLDYYAEFSQYLDEHYRRIWDNERCIIYSLAQLGSGRTQVQQDRSFWQRAVRRASLLLGRA